MTLTEAQVDELEKVAAPLMAWIEENCHPHVHVIVDGQDAALFEAVAAIVGRAANARRAQQDDDALPVP